MDFSNMFGGQFGKIAPGMCRLTMNGDIAVKTNNGYKSYNLKKGTLTNVTNFCFDIGQEFFFVIPTSKVKPGDIILVDNKPRCVLEADKNKIVVIDYEASERKEIIPERHVFMGRTYFYGKIVSMFGGSLKSSKGVNKIFQMMMMKDMFSGNGTSDSNGMMQMMMMSQMMGGGSNMFENMFDFDLEEADEEDEE